MVESLCDKKLRIGIIGLGNIGRRHIDPAKKYGSLVAVCDEDKNIVDAVVSEHGCTGYVDIGSMLSNNTLDLAVVCTPNYLHMSQSIKSLESGCHVLCEKPMALSVVDCERMIHTSEHMNRRLFIVKQNRLNPILSDLKRLIDEGGLGRIFNVSVNCFWNRNNDYYKSSYWRGKKDLDGGVLFTQFSHFIDLLYWMFDDIDCVTGFSDNFNHKDTMDFDDTGVYSFHFRNGVIGSLSYTVNSFGGNMEGSISVFGSKGTVKIGGHYLNKIVYQNIEGSSLEEYVVDPKMIHSLVYKNAVDVLSSNGNIVTDMLDGLKNVQMIKKFYNVRRVDEIASYYS